jgi:uncharacterized SAM-binding protein YcdF (DUF218 family)
MDVLFILKKLIGYFLVPPGLFIAALFVLSLFLKKKAKLMILSLCALLYLSSIEPTKDLLLMPLEDAYKIPATAELKGYQAYVVLGSSIVENAPDLSGPGVLDGDALHRVMGAYRLYRISPKPIILSGGTLSGSQPEAEISKRYLLSLGIKEEHLLAESRSKDTVENARFTKDICDSRKIKSVVVITSAFHMKRSVMLFKRVFSDVLPFPTAFRVARKTRYGLFSFIPDPGSLCNVSLALKEHIGILFYTFRT